MPVTAPLPNDIDLARRLDAALLGSDDGRPDPDGSARLRTRVLDLVEQERRSPTAPATRTVSRRTRWLAAAAVGAALLTGGVVIPGAVAEAEAHQVLTDLARSISVTPTPVPRPGQYLRVESHSPATVVAADGTDRTSVREDTRYYPADPGGEVIWVDVSAFDGTTAVEAHGPDFGTPAGLARRLGLSDLGELPRDPDALRRFFRDRYTGGSASPGEDLFVQLTDALRTPGLPADLRSALISAIADAPGARVEPSVTLSDGRTGVGLRRAEPLRMGQAQEIVLDPVTGEVIGERSLAGFGVGDLGASRVVSETTTTTTIVDEAPTPTVHYVSVEGPDGGIEEQRVDGPDVP